MDRDDHPRASYRTMAESTAGDWAIIAQESAPFQKGLADRVLAHLRLLEGDYGGFPVDRLTHCLQTATRAHQAGEDDEYVVCALLHDIGDTLGPANHADIAAAILRPYVSEKNHWIVAHHAIFQGYYFFHHLGLDRNMRDAFRDHEWFQDCARFCHAYDQNSFDPDFESLPLSVFEPMVRAVFARPKRSIYVKDEAAAAAS